MKKIFLFLGFIIILGLSAGCAQRFEGVNVDQVWARPGISGGNSAAYFTIENSSGEDDVLLSANTDIARAVELHMSSMGADGTMMMQPQESVPISAGEKVEFKPGGLHVMLIDLPEELTPEQTFPLTLRFQNAGEVTVTVTVREP